MLKTITHLLYNKVTLYYTMEKMKINGSDFIAGVCLMFLSFDSTQFL